MKRLLWIGMVLLMAACSGQAPKKESREKEPVETARDVAMRKLAEAETLKDSLEHELQAVTQKESDMTAYVMENATQLADDAPEVQELNNLRKQKVGLQNKIGLYDGQIKLLKRDLKIE